MLEYFVTGAVGGLILGTCAAVSMYRQRLKPPHWWNPARCKVFNRDTLRLCFGQFVIGGAVGFSGGVLAVLGFKAAQSIVSIMRYL